MDQKTIEALGDSLYDALVARTPIAPLSAAHPDMTIEDAYHVQQRMIARRLEKGDRVIGKKIGVTSKAVMNMLGVHQPDFGYLLDSMVFNEGESVDMDTLIQPKAEGEIAFLLKKDLQGPGVTAADVLAATEGVMACFEIVDSRIPLALAFGAFLEWALFSHLYKRDHLEQVLLTYGLILIFEQLRSLLVGDDVHGVAIPAFLDASIQLTEVMSYPVYRLAISAVCIVLAVALYYVIQRTRLGMMIRAGNDDRGMVEALGININMIYRVVFALGVALAALAGMLAAPISSVFPNMGSHVLIISFVIVVIGGIGSVWGALVAALIVGFADTFGKVLVPELSGIVVYVVMAVVLLWRPEGILKKG